MSKSETGGFFDLEGKVAAVTGGGGILCSTLCKALARAGVRVAVLDINPESAARVADEIRSTGGTAISVAANVLERSKMEAACVEVIEVFGGIDILINGAGGNSKGATTSDNLSFFDLDADAIRAVFDLNCLGTILPSQEFGKELAKKRAGSILNISSMNSYRPLTRIPAYSAAKAAVSNFTQWLAVHMCRNFSIDIRVNAIAPGFFLTDQNRFLLTDEKTGELTARGKTIIEHTPMGRFGKPEDLISTAIWLLSPGASFINGAVIPVDGGFSAFSGV